jgi:hypothetical protein
LVAGNVELGAIAWLLVGSVPGVLIGSQVSVGVPERTLRFALAAALVLSGLKLLEVPYSNVLITVALSSGLVALSVWSLVVIWRPSRRNLREPVESSSPPQATSAGQLPTPPESSERTAP